MFKSVRIRLTALTVAIVVFLYLALGVGVYGLVRNIVFQGIDNQLRQVAVLARTRNMSTIVNRLPAETYVVELARKGVTSNAPANIQTSLVALAEKHKSTTWKTSWSPDDTHWFEIVSIPLQPADPLRGNVIVASNAQRELDVLTRLRHVLWLVGGIGAVVAAMAGFFLAERALKPVRRAWQQQVEFVADASHELRTPIAVIQSNLGVVLEHTEQSVSDNLEWVHNAYSEARRMSKLVDDLLTLARGDALAAPIQTEVLQLSELVETVCELFQPVVSAKSQVLECTVDGPVYVVGDRDRLHQLLVILLDNACKYTQASGRITVLMQRNKSAALLSVADTGVGIAPDDVKRVFERFFQSDTSRSREQSRGVGLGLAIGKWIVDAHRGSIDVASQLGKGTTFTITLPLAATPGKTVPSL